MNEDRKIRVLCVEDEQDIRDTMAEILRDENFEVFEAANGKQGFESFMHDKPDIIISDIMMPEVDGYGFLNMVRQSKTKNNTVPFIFLSALGQKENILKGANLSANDYLVKPIDFDILIAKIREKTINALKVQEVHKSNIQNIKSQIAVALPSEIFSHLDTMSQMLKILKEEPYGPFPHRRYLEDINKLYFDSIKLKAAVTNALDHDVIDKKLNVDEEVFALSEFLDQAIANLPEKIRPKVEFDRPYEDDAAIKIKMEKAILVDVLKKILVGVIKFDSEATIRISIMNDALNQTLIVFFIKAKGDVKDLEENIDSEKIKSISDAQGCYFKLSQNELSKEMAAILSIPSHRIMN